jgi:hypothetical protein
MRIDHTCGISTGRFADANLVSSRDVLWNHYGGRIVKVTRLVTGALRRPRGIKTKNGASPEEAVCRLADRQAAASGIGPGAGTSRDGWRNFAQSDFGANDLQTKQRILGLRRKRARLRRAEEPAEAPC